MSIKQIKKVLAGILIATSVTVHAQAAMKNYKAGHVFDISLPEYMVKTTGLNSAATIQFKNTVKDIAGFVIEDSKEKYKKDFESIMLSIKD